jgi:peptidoglycan hydrolase CwlO-like protein
LGAREAELQQREEELAAAVHDFEAERDQAAEADAQQRRRMLEELRQLEAGVEAAMGQLREAEEEAASVRRRVLETQGEAAEAEAARDKALLAHKAAQQVGQVV